MFQIIQRKDCDRSTWDAAADGFSTAWAWHRSEMLDARTTWKRTEDFSFCVCDPANGKKIVAIVPLVLVRSRFMHFLLGGHLESTGAPALDPDLPRRSLKKVQECILDTVEGYTAANRLRRTDFSIAPLSPELRTIDRPFPNPLCFLGAKDASTQSWMLKLNVGGGDEELWRGLEHRSRKQINKAERAGLVAEIFTPNLQILESYYELHLQTCRRNGISPHRKEYFSAIFQSVAQQGLCKTCVVRAEGKVLTIQNFLIYKAGALYWTVASSDDALNLCANDYGMWAAIKYLRAMGMEYLECGEAFPAVLEGKQRGLNDFKRSFGGQLFPYYRGSIYHRPLLEGFLGMLRHCRKGGAAT